MHEASDCPVKASSSREGSTARSGVSRSRPGLKLGPTMQLLLSHLDSPLGEMLLVTDDLQNIRALDFADHEARLYRRLRERYGRMELANCPAPVGIARVVASYFSGELDALYVLPATASAGSDLQRRVWAALQGIPAGTRPGRQRPTASWLEPWVPVTREPPSTSVQPMPLIRSPSSCPAIVSLPQMATSKAMPGECTDERTALVARVCRLIETSQASPSLDELARTVGMSPYHLHRVFKAEAGLTPKTYASAYRARKLRQELNAPNASVTGAIYGAGFNSNSRFYETSNQLLGMRARDYRAGGIGAAIRFAVGQCSLGAILVAQSQQGICAILLGEDPDGLVRDLQDQFPKAQFIGADAEFEHLIAHVVGFIELPSIGLNLPLDVRGTAFQERVWQALREIPPGTTVTYTEIARRIGAPKAVRAVAQACGANHIAVAIPCLSSSR